MNEAELLQHFWSSVENGINGLLSCRISYIGVYGRKVFIRPVMKNRDPVVSSEPVLLLDCFFRATQCPMVF